MVTTQKMFLFKQFTSHSAYVATSTELHGVKIDGFLSVVFLLISNLTNRLHLHQFLGINPKGVGGASKCPIGQKIGYHFPQDHAMVTKILDFIHKHPN